jgi:hypothetical protein
MNCLLCDNIFLLDFTQLKLNDVIKYGVNEFLYCYTCILIKNKPCLVATKGRCDGFLDDLIDEDDDVFYSDGFDVIKDEFQNYHDEDVRIIGRTNSFLNIKEEELKNIKKKVLNCKRTDKTNFNEEGNIDIEFILKMIKTQNYICHKCHSNFITADYKPYCCNQFSIDRLDNNLPHNKDNVKISCYFCNCKEHYMYNQTEKECNILECNCRKILQFENPSFQNRF